VAARHVDILIFSLQSSIYGTLSVSLGAATYKLEDKSQRDWRLTLELLYLSFSAFLLRVLLYLPNAYGI